MDVSRLGAAAAVAALLLVPAAPASAAQDQLRGSQVIDSQTGVATMSGDLVGDWYTLTFDLAGAQPSGTLQATGSELFVGCWDVDRDGACGGDDVVGWLAFDFHYSASAGGTGRCHHPVVGGGDGFAGATGQLTFKDRVGACGQVVTTYSGHIDL